MSTPPRFHIQDHQLAVVAEKALSGERLTFDDGLVLERTTDLRSVLRVADAVRRRKHGNRAAYIVNAHVDHTNICQSQCRFCAYYRTEFEKDAFTLTPEEACRKVPVEVDEIHVVGGVNPSLHLGYFTNLLKTLKKRFPEAALKAFTAVELHALAERDHIGIRDLLTSLKEAGLSMIPGGGAEIFDSEIRRRACPSKASSDEWLAVHRIAHEFGIPSNSTMLHGHIEKPAHRIEHLLRLRELQDETGGFVAHVPLPYLRENNDLAGEAAAPDSTMDLRQIALARLILDNIPHIKSYWRALGIRLAQAGLNAGADDLDGTVISEDIMHEAGSDSPRGLTSEQMERIIREAGFEPFRRDSFHNPIGEADA